VPTLLWPNENRNQRLPYRAFDERVLPLTIGRRAGVIFCDGFALLVPRICPFCATANCATVFLVALFPLAQAWDPTFADEELARRAEKQIEQARCWRAISLQIDGHSLRPWWFSTAISYCAASWGGREFT